MIGPPGSMEYLYGMACVGLSVPVFVHLLNRYLRDPRTKQGLLDFYHSLAQAWRVELAKTRLILRRLILRRNKHG